MNRILLSTASALIIIGTSSASAAVVSYSSADFTNVNQVSANGTLVEAVNLGHGDPGGVTSAGVATTAVVLNGVTFASDPGDGSGQFVVDSGSTTPGTFRSGQSNDANNVNAYNPATVITGLSAADGNALLDSLEFGGGLNNSTARLTGLSIGTQYEFQVLLSNASTSDTYSVGFAEVSGSTTEVYVLSGISAAVPTIVTGTFTADEANQDIHIARSGASNIEAGAFQLRVVPEPGSLALLGLGGLLIARRRRG
ncbi:MAG: PEP-CTERM sorting domain-containing protein [Planctomycetota bacterium]